MYKIVRGLIDLKLCDIGLSMNVSNTRSNNVRLVLPRPRTNILKCSFAYRTASIYNRLPIDVVNASTLCIFVTRLHSINVSILRGQPA